MARHKDFVPTQVLDQAIDLFWRQGYEATSIQDLVDQMGIGRGSLYDTFGDKHCLFLAALDLYISRIYTNILPLLEETVPTQEALRHMLTRVVDLAMDERHPRGCLLTNTQVELGLRDSEVAQRLRTMFARFEEALVASLARGQGNGEITLRHSPQALAHFLFTTMQGLRVMAKAVPDRTLLDEVITVTVRSIA